MSSVIVTVTREDILMGIRNAAEDCPIALACKRAIGERFVSAHYGGTCMTEDYLGDWPSSPDVWEWMRRFDDGQPVEPFEFELQVEP